MAKNAPLAFYPGIPEEKIGELLTSFLDSDLDCIVLVDAEARVIWLNRAYETYLGVKRRDVIGKHVTEVIENTRLHIVVRTGVAEIGEIQNIKGRYAVVSRIPIFKNGRVVGAAGKVSFKTRDEVSQLASKVKWLENEVNYYKRELTEKFCAKWSFSDIITCSPKMEKIKQVAQRLAAIDINILILGETGVGKELFAHAIHSASKRSKKPFVYINCAAIPDNLVESELFGYEPGAFTSAKREGKPGKLELAHGGTVFLDEIGDMSPLMQAKILRFLQEGELEKVGAVRPSSVNTRVISATNRDLTKMIAEGSFRADLYYRLSGAVLEIPPLRERKEDIPLLCDHFLQRLAEKWVVPPKKLDPEVVEFLQRYHWPGNVRELQHLLERAYSMASGETITIWDFPSHIFSSPQEETGKEVSPPGGTALLSKTKDQAEKKLIEKVLKEAGGNKKKAAELLGIHRTTLYYKLRKYNLI